MKSGATTVGDYLKEVPDERRPAISAVRQMILENLPDGYEEVMNWGMITYQVPLTTYSDTYKKATDVFGPGHPKESLCPRLAGSRRPPSPPDKPESHYKKTPGPEPWPPYSPSPSTPPQAKPTTAAP